MKYLILVIAYIFSFFGITIWVCKKNKIDVYDYENRKKEIEKQTLNLLANYMSAMLLLNLATAFIYKLFSFQFLSFNSMLIVLFNSLIGTGFIALYHPKLFNTDICWLHRLALILSEFIFMFFLLEKYIF